MFCQTQDALLVRQTAASLRIVAAPKAVSAANLRRAFGASPVRADVLFSSIAALLGTPGQSNYAMANEELNVFAHALQLTGLPCIGIMWGPWTVGMAAREAALLARFERSGLSAVTAGAGLAALDRMSGLSVTCSSPPVVVAAPVAWHRFHLSGSGGGAAASQLFSELVHGPLAPTTAAPAGLSAVPAATAQSGTTNMQEVPLKDFCVL
jgi:KR domain